MSSNDILTYDYPKLRASLVDEGWRTPQCYSNTYADAGDFPAVYLFLLVGDLEFTHARPAYVGMSTRLAQRWSGHSVLTELNGLGHWVQRWFLKVPQPELRSVEAEHIQRFDPPWNVIGRKRGVAAL